MRFPYERQGGEPLDEAEHFIQCQCGRWLDMRDLGQILEHEEKCEGPRPDEDAGKPSPTAN